jgi:DNA-binding HxlR family transcriptional regulator
VLTAVHHRIIEELVKSYPADIRFTDLQTLVDDDVHKATFTKSLKKLTKLGVAKRQELGYRNVVYGIDVKQLAALAKAEKQERDECNRSWKKLLAYIDTLPGEAF